MESIPQLFARILEFVVALGVLIFIHELGHYFFAKLFKVEVEEFGFGFPPRMVRLFRYKETDFTLNWIPFGAFVRPKGENDPNVVGGMAAAAAWKRLLILFGGPLFNLIAAVLLFILYFSVAGVLDRQRVQIAGINSASPAENAGLQVGDILVNVQGQAITNIDQIKAIVSANLGKEITIVYSREGVESTVRAVPRLNPPEGQGALGIYMGNPVVQVPWWQTPPYAFREVGFQVESLIHLPGRLMRGEVAGEEARVVSIVGMGQIYNQIPNLILRLAFIATISTALGLTNLLPLPALDGGRILFVLPELLFRKRIPQQYENAVHMIGFATLIILMIFITARDIINPIQF